MTGRTSQRKGRRAELADLKDWEHDGYYVRDRRRLEAASVAVGVDYEVTLNRQDWPAHLWVQVKHRKRPNCLAAYLEAADAVSHFGAGSRVMPVAHVKQDHGPSVAILSWDDFKQLVRMTGE